MLFVLIQKLLNQVEKFNKHTSQTMLYASFCFVILALYLARIIIVDCILLNIIGL